MPEGRGGFGAEDASDSKPLASHSDGSPVAASLHEILAQQPLVHAIGMKLKRIPSGTFQMGSKASSPEEQLVHQVRIPVPRERNDWIIALDDDYAWAMVGTPDRRFLWILARERQLPPEIYAALVARARCLGFDVDRLVRQ